MVSIANDGSHSVGIIIRFESNPVSTLQVFDVINFAV